MSIKGKCSSCGKPVKARNIYGRLHCDACWMSVLQAGNKRLSNKTLAAPKTKADEQRCDDHIREVAAAIKRHNVAMRKGGNAVNNRHVVSGIREVTDVDGFEADEMD